MSQVREFLRCAFRGIDGVVRSRQGGTTTFLAAAIIPLVAFGGLAIDTARGYLVKTRLQYALDAAALAGGGAMFDETKRDAAIMAIFKANLPAGYMGATVNGPHISVNGVDQTIKVEAVVALETSLMRVVGINEMNVSAVTEVQRQVKGMELALVLDITGSMRETTSGSVQSKLEDLRDAAAKLVDILYAGRDEVEDFYVAVVPYTGTVNIGKQHANWLYRSYGGGSGHGGHGHGGGGSDLPYDPPSNTNPEPYDPSDYNPTSWKGCVEARYRHGRDRNDDPPFAERFYPHFWPSDRDYLSYIFDDLELRAIRNNPWNKWHINEDHGDFGHGPNLNCGNPIVPLVKSRSTIEDAIDDLEYWRYGGTIGNQGLVWGWRVISPRWRGLWDGDDSSDLPKDYIADLIANEQPPSDKVVVMMTDGYNNIGYVETNRHDGHYTAYGKPDWGRLGTTSDDGIKAAINNRMLETCTLMKQQEIVIYTVTFDTEGEDYEDIRDLYRDCATSPAHYYNSPGSDELTSAFIAIGTQLSNLRLAK